MTIEADKDPVREEELEEISDELEEAVLVTPTPVVAPATSEEVAVKPVRKKGKRMTPAEHEEANNIWELGTMTLLELSKKYGVSVNALHKYFSKHHVIPKSRAHEVKAAITAAIKEKAVEVADTFETKKAMRIETAKENIYRGGNLFHSASLRITAKALNDGGNALEGQIGNLKALEIATKIALKASESIIKSLGMDRHVDESNLPKIEFVDLTEEDIDKIQNRSEDEDMNFADLETPEDDEGIVKEGLE